MEYVFPVTRWWEFDPLVFLFIYPKKKIDLILIFDVLTSRSTIFQLYMYHGDQF